MLVRCLMTCLVFAGESGNSTVRDISLLLRSTPSFTVLSLSSRLVESFSRRSPTVRMRSPLNEVMTSPAFRPAFSAGEPGFTSWTKMPSPSGAPKNVPSWPLRSSASMPSRGCPSGNVFFAGQPRLGIDAEDLSGQLGTFFGAPDGEGILVHEVNPGSPAEKAGLKAGDVIISFNGERIRTVGDLREKLSTKRENKDKTVKLGVLRSKSEISLTVELPDSPAKTKHVIKHRTNI